MADRLRKANPDGFPFKHFAARHNMASAHRQRDARALGDIHISAASHAFARPNARDALCLCLVRRGNLCAALGFPASAPHRAARQQHRCPHLSFWQQLP